MNRRQRIAIAIAIIASCLDLLPAVIATDAKYMHFRTIQIDGNGADWSGIGSNAIITRIRRQAGETISIANGTFVPGNISVHQGTALIWVNEDEITNDSKVHQIAFGEEAPVTWTSVPLSYGGIDHVTVESVSHFTYHTSRVNFYAYPDGNITIIGSTWKDINYGISLASTQTHLYVLISILNVSNDPADGLYLKGIDVVMDDFADGSLEGDNAFRVMRTMGGFTALDAFYELGELVPDSSDGGSSDFEMAFEHEMPDFENTSIDYAGDFTFEIAVPINSQDFRDIGASAGMSIGMEVILRLSDGVQDENSRVEGVGSFYQGGGYPIILTHDDEDVSKLSLDSEKFMIIGLRGADILEVISTILEEAWIWILSVIAMAFSSIFGAIVRFRKKNVIKCTESGCPDKIS